MSAVNYSEGSKQSDPIERIRVKRCIEDSSCSHQGENPDRHTRFQEIILEKIIFTNSSRILTTNTVVIFWA